MSISFPLTWWNKKKPDFGQTVRYINFARHTSVHPSGCATLNSHQQWGEAATIATFTDIVCSGMLALLMTAQYLFFGFYLLITYDGNIFFIYLFAIWTFAIGEVSVQISCPHFNCVWCLLILKFYGIFVSLGYWSFIRYVFCKYFFFLVCNLFLCVPSFIFCRF